MEEEEPRNSAKLNLAAYRSIAWPPSKAQEKDPREELARTASDLAAAVAGLACQEGEEEVNVDPDTLKADVVVISEPDWGASDPEIQEALVPMTKLEESLEVKTEARSEPGETLQEAGPAAPATKFEELPVAKAEARFEPGEALQEAAPGVKAEEELRPSAPNPAQAVGPGEAPAADPQPTPAAGSVKGEPDARAEAPVSPKSSDACIPSKMSDRPSGPKWETDRCKEEADGGEGAGPSRARDDPAPARDRALIPKGGLKLGSGKLRLLQEIARADEANWQRTSKNSSPNRKRIGRPNKI